LSKLSGRDRERIKNVRESASKTLDLSNWPGGHAQLKNIPEEVYELAQLEELNLQHNQIRVVSDRICKLPNLKKLNLSRNPIKTVPDMPGLMLDWEAYLRCPNLSPGNIVGINIGIGRPVPKASRPPAEIVGLANLKYLEVGQDMITVEQHLAISKPTPSIRRLIDILDKLGRLEELVLFGVMLGEVPPSIRNLEGLRTLNLGATGLRDVPGWMSELQHLTSLRLRLNELDTLPASLSNLVQLTSVSLGGNRFTEIPQVLFRIKSLTHIDIETSRYSDEVRIKQIPAEILGLRNLETLEVDARLIETPPPEVVKDGVQAIKNYWRQQKESGVDYLCEAKLLIVGEAGAGKTSLAKKIKDRNYKLKRKEDSTEGIEVIHWSFPAAIRVKHDDTEDILQRDFRVNIWDFGGQEVYHATHQFFLTRRSLYVLVVDDRKEDTDFDYWLQVVDLLSDGSPLLIVQNQKLDRRRDINLGSLRARFPNLKNAHQVNLATNAGLDALSTAIRQELEHLSHIGVPLPKTWRLVRETLEKDSRNYIGVEDYLTICQQHGFKRREDKLQLSGYLHDLGICLHFQDDPVLKQTVILKPKWGTDAVYRVLDDHTVTDNRGRFGPEDLTRIWSEDDYAPMRDELLRLMMKFQLCYQLPEGEAYIAPQLLSPTQPSYAWDGDANLILRYEYDFMPKGLITRLIVGLHHRIADQSLVWKSGVILERDSTRAEIIEDYLKRKISVRVTGTDTRGFLAIVDDQLERIHRSFPTLKCEKYLPCNCEVCKKRSDPFGFSLRELKDFAQTGDHIQCRISRKMVDAAILIRDVFPQAARRIVEPEMIASDASRTLLAASDKEVFVSYAWTDESKALVTQLENVFKDRGISLIRDQNELQYKDLIGDFMKRIGRRKCIIVVLSERYLRSKNCMFELVEIAERGNISDRVFPVVLKDAHIYDAKGRLQYIKYWEQQKKQLDTEMKKVGGENLRGIREELDLFAKIRATIDRIVDVLGNMNALTQDQHEGSDFKQLIRALEVRLSE